MAKARRAKKSKFPKKLLLVPVALIGIGTTVATFNTNTTISKSIGAQVETQEASNFVKDIFTEENTRYLPIKYMDPYERLTREQLDEEFRKAGMPIKSFSTATIGTGTKIETENATYTVLIYGDIDGNGEVNVRDVQAIVKHLLYGNGNELKGISRIAANVDNEKENVINVRDAQRIVQFILGKKSIIDSTPTSDLIKDKEAPVITLNGEKEVKVKVFEKYEDIGATVKDNLDPNVKVDVDTSKVNTSIPGTYEVYYNATDASGNKAQTVTRKVIVEDYIDGIEISIFPKQQYVVGQVPDISTMIAYPIYKYGGQGNEAVDVKEITVTPSIITEDMIGNSELKINYKGFEKVIPIIVTEQVPIIELKNYNGATDVKLRVNEIYNEETDVKAYDEQDNKYYDVSISGTVDMTTPGEYIITYTSEPNSIGKVGKLERKVTVLDYIEDVKFIIDTTKFLDTKTYLDKDIIDITGITASLKYATGKVETTDKLTFDKVAKYKQGSISQELVISYEAVDPIDPKITKTYVSTNNTYDINDTSFSNSTNVMIKVCKRFTSTSLVGTAKSVAKIYEDTIIATVTEGTDEALISVGALDIKVSPGNVDEHGCTARAWAEPSIRQTGALDIHFVGVMNRGDTSPVTSYTITLTPKAEDRIERNIAVVTEASEVVNEVQMNNAKVDGKALESETEFQKGTTLTADLNFFRNYSYNQKNHLIGINKKIDSVTLRVCEPTDLTNTITGVTATLVKNSANVVTGVSIEATDSATASDSGRNMLLVVDVNNGANGSYRGTLNMKLYEKSRYTLETNSLDTITLGYREIKSTDNDYDGYEIKEINGKYYTILPISIYDQYVARTITSADLNNAIKFDIMKKGATSYVSANNNIEVIGLNDSYSQVNTGITNLGIAIKGNEEELEQAKALRISFGSSYKEYNNSTSAIVIKRRAVSNLEDYSTWASGEYSGTGECYKDIKAVKVTSGEKQEKLTIAELKNIGYIIEKEVTENGATKREKILDTLPSRDEFSSSSIVTITETNNSVSANAASLKVGVTTTIENGVATIALWSGNTGKYYVTPYYKTNTNTANSSNGITVTENMEVNAIKINGQAKYIGTAPIGSPKTFEIKFIHEYKDTINKTGNASEEGEVTNISNTALTFDIAGNIIEEIQMVASSGDKNVIISYEKDSVTGDYVSDSTYDNALIKNIRIFIKAGVSLSESAISTEEFTIKIDHSKIVESKIKTKYSQEFTIGAEESLEIHHLNIGGTDSERDISIVTTPNGAKIVNDRKNDNDNTNPISSEEVYLNPTDSLYYTMIPINFAAEDNTPIATKELKGGLIKSSTITIGDTTQGYITFIDNSYATGAEFFGDQTRLPVKGFKKQSDGTFVEKESLGENDYIDYIGIAFSDSGIAAGLVDEKCFFDTVAPDWFTADPSAYGVTSWEEVRLKEIKIYYEGNVIKTLNIVHVK